MTSLLESGPSSLATSETTLYDALAGLALLLANGQNRVRFLEAHADLLKTPAFRRKHLLAVCYQVCRWEVPFKTIVCEAQA